MSLIWFVLMALSIFFLLFKSPDLVLSTCLEVSSSTLSFCLQMCAIYALWMGFMQIMEDSKLTDKLAKLISPLIRKLFRIKDDKIEKNLALNISANILGIGSIATISGIEAMHDMEEKNGGLSFGMIMLVVLSSSSLQLLPTTVVALRQTLGSTAPYSIIVPTLLSTMITTIFAVAGVIMFDKIKKRTKKC